MPRQEVQTQPEYFQETIQFNPEKYGASLPEGSIVLLENNLGKPFLMRKEGDIFVYDGVFPAGNLECTFLAYPAGREGEPMVFPAEGQKETYEFGEAEEASKGRQVVSLDKFREKQGVKGHRERVRKDVAFALGEEGEGEPEGAMDLLEPMKGETMVGMERARTKRDIRDLLSRAEELKLPKGARDVHKYLLAVADRLARHAETGGEQMQLFLQRDLRTQIADLHNEAIRRNPKLKGEAREALGTEEGRLQFEVAAFTLLASSSKLGLKPKHEPSEGVAQNEERFHSYARKRLGNKRYEIFTRVVSRYHMGSLGNALRAVADEISASPLINEKSKDAKNRASERATLIRKITERVGKEMETGYSKIEDSGRMAGFLNASGDFALKASAILLLAANPAILGGIGITAAAAGGLWFGRGISNALGYDFSKVLRKIAKAPFKVIGNAAKAGLNFLPEKWRSAINIEDLVNGLNPPKFEKVGRAELPFKTRMKLLWRGFFPAPAFLGHLKYVKEIIPEEKFKVGEQAVLQERRIEGEIDNACKDALAGLAEGTSREETHERTYLEAA